MRLEHANLQWEAAHKKKEHRSINFSFRISNSCSRLLLARLADWEYKPRLEIPTKMPRIQVFKKIKILITS